MKLYCQFSGSEGSFDLWDSKSEGRVSHPVQSTDDTEVKRESKYSTAVSEDGHGSMESGYNRQVIN